MRSYLDYDIDQNKIWHKKKSWTSILKEEKPEQNVIKKWCKKPNIEKELPWLMPISSIYNHKELPEDVNPCEAWEARLLHIAGFFDVFFELSEWEKLSNENRFNHSMKVAKLSRELANLLEISNGPYYPPVLEFFDSERAVDIIRSLPEKTSKALLSTTGYSINDKTGYEQSKPPNYFHAPENRLALRFLFPEPQHLSSLLRNLAKYTEKTLKESKRDKRPNTGNPNARAFARHLSCNFKSFFNRTPNEVIAACVCIRFPDLPNPPTEETIREWRGVK